MEHDEQCEMWRGCHCAWLAELAAAKLSRCTCAVTPVMSCPVHGYSGCYSPGLEHNRCQAGHPIHHDTTGRYEADTWIHCLIADVVACPHDSEQILDVRPGKHRVTP